ncbi:hypothetical protein F5Y19DRAFT_228225 [Xylariaceae sp. FL1651]|nr:hypothetical protein F5Y19DRAFT_228225 [Xylariaceae sp. FL1651]
MMNPFLLSLVLMAISVAGFTAHQLFEFPNATFVENIAVRSNGHILVTTFDQARLYTIDPTGPSYPTIVAQIPGETALAGITELTPSKCAVAAGILGNLNFTDSSSSVWLIDFGIGTDEGQPSVTLAANIPEANILNGIVSLPKYRDVILAIDSIQGVMYRINTTLGKVDVAFEDKLLGLGDTPVFPLGANGIKIHDGYLYFAQSAQQFFGRVRISDIGDKVGDIEKIVSTPGGFLAYDDFVMTKGGVSYVTMHPNGVAKITRDGKQTVLYDADDIPNLREPTSAALSWDETKLYVTTGGNQTDEQVYGGQIVEIEL